MKNLFNSFYSVVLLALCLIAFSNCSDSDDGGEVGGTDNGITAISSETEKTVSLYGETVEISFTASGKWTPSLQYSTGSDWAAITNTSGSSTAGKGGFRVKVDKNEAGQNRILTVLVQVEGYKTPEVVCTITQSGSGDVSSADIALNEFMHNYLKEHYLFKDEYNTLEVDCKNVSYDNFLSTYLLKMKTNTEDGGISRAYSVNAGQRYIYSYIEKVGSSDTRATTRATSMVGTGLGTFFSSYMADRTTIGLSIGYVFVDSPAAKAGLRRGDVIVAVNGVTLNKNNYQQYMNALYYASGGESFNIGYRRYADVLMMYAEAVVSGGTQASNMTPLQAVNKVRGRANMSELPSVTMADIQNERILEFALEGHRFYDLLRWGKLASRFTELQESDPNFKKFISADDFKGFVTNKHEWLPIPINEVNSNPYITENNPGY